jgi:hypothetical protein
VDQRRVRVQQRRLGQASPGLTHIHDTLLTAMRTLHDPGDIERRAAHY